jgi:hypothetical protein
MMPYRVARVTSAGRLVLALSMGGGSAVARAAAAQDPGTAARPVAVRGVVFDSITRAPLARVRVDFVRADSLGTPEIAATTSAAGAFGITLASGKWLAAIEDPRFDSLGVKVPARTIEIQQARTASVQLATPSSKTITRLLCGEAQAAGDVAMVGVVRTVSNAPLDSAAVRLQWLDLTLTHGAVERSADTRVTRTQRGGWYTLCGVPGGATALASAEFGATSTGTVAIAVAESPIRLDLMLDTSAAGNVASARYRAVVRALSGKPIPHARARVIGHRYYMSNDDGIVVLDSLSLGSQTLEVVALGYAPLRRTLEVASSDAPADSIVLMSAESVLDTVRVIAGRDPTGFAWRRSLKVGQFITAADIERENPRTTTSLIRARDAMRYTLDAGGHPYVAMAAGPGRGNCTPFVLLDGFPIPPGPSVAGLPTVDWSLHPRDIGGVEIYVNPAQVPPQFRNFPGEVPSCGVIAFWTRERLGVPPKAPSGPP